MALAATHIKFALDIKDVYDIKNIAAYVAGTSYPDSRYISGIDREKTHFEELLSQEFLTTDFKKGWSVHALCDKVQNTLFHQIFPDCLEGVEHGGGKSEWWIRVSALKGLQEILVMKEFDIQPYLPLLEYVENPNSERLEDVTKFNQIIQRLYKDKKSLTPKEVASLWTELGVENNLVSLIEEKINTYLENPGVVKRMEKVYQEMITAYKTI